MITDANGSYGAAVCNGEGRLHGPLVYFGTCDTIGYHVYDDGRDATAMILSNGQ